jgi:hypothetical protein
VIVGVDEDHVGARVGGNGFTTEGSEDAEKKKEGFHSGKANSRGPRELQTSLYRIRTTDY